MKTKMTRRERKERSMKSFHSRNLTPTTRPTSQILKLKTENLPQLNSSS